MEASRMSEFVLKLNLRQPFAPFIRKLLLERNIKLCLFLVVWGRQRQLRVYLADIVLLSPLISAAVQWKRWTTSRCTLTVRVGTYELIYITYLYSGLVNVFIKDDIVGDGLPLNELMYRVTFMYQLGCKGNNYMPRTSQL